MPVVRFRRCLSLLCRCRLPTQQMTAARETHKRGREGWLRAVVLGADDGVVSTASLMIGLAASHAENHAVLVAGVAGLVAGALSMAAASMSLSARSGTASRPTLDKEKKELAEDPVGAHLGGAPLWRGALRVACGGGVTMTTTALIGKTLGVLIREPERLGSAVRCEAAPDTFGSHLNGPSRIFAALVANEADFGIRDAESADTIQVSVTDLDGAPAAGAQAMIQVQIGAQRVGMPKTADENGVLKFAPWFQIPVDRIQLTAVLDGRSGEAALDKPNLQAAIQLVPAATIHGTVNGAQPGTVLSVFILPSHLRAGVSPRCSLRDAGLYLALAREADFTLRLLKL